MCAVPTFAEAGTPEAAYESWFGLLVPAGVPSEIVGKLNRDIADVMSIPEVANRLAQQGVTASTNSAADFNALLRSDAERFGKMFEKASK